MLSPGRRTIRDRKREYELDTLDQFPDLARHLELEADLETPEVMI